MTDKERIEKTYEKIKKKYPHIYNKQEIDDLAIGHEKKTALLSCLGFAAAAIVCFVIAFSIRSDTFADTRAILFITGAFSIYEIFHILAKFSKIEKMYRPVQQVQYQGVLTAAQILKDGKKALKKVENRFAIQHLPLYDKEDEMDVGIDNMTSHSYRLYFQLHDTTAAVPFETKRNVYMDAAIGGMYFVVVTPNREIAAVYQASNWSLDPSLGRHMFQPAPQQPAPPQSVPQQPLYQPVLQQPLYQPMPVVQTSQREETKKLLPILSMVLAIIGGLCPVIVAVVVNTVALVLSIIALTKQRSKLSITATILCVIFFLLTLGVLIYYLT